MRVQKRRAVSHAGWLRTLRASALALGAVVVVVGCALGAEQEPGCHHDADCGEGFTCRAGACFRTTTDRSPPATDGGDAAAGDAG